ncbi:MAG TPA: hypothetical protein DCW90_07875 [Lachnospiraceae bacterium]|nr:hypothetical protein [Lachnospiraceae bacterium]
MLRRKGAGSLNRNRMNGTELEVSDICLGGGSFGSKLTMEQSYEVLDRYVASGGNFIDTAKVYCSWIPGMDRISETIIGTWLKKRGNANDFVIATKGAHYNFETPTISRVSKEDVYMDLDESRKILGMDTIDFYWLHQDDESKEIGEIIDFMDQLVEEGKIRYYGASNYSVERLKEAEAYAKKHGKQGFSAVSNQWSLASKRDAAIEAEKKDGSLITTSYEQYCWHVNSKKPLVPYSAIAEGFFFKMYQGGRRIHMDNRVTKQEDVSVYWTDRNMMIYNDMLKLNKELGLSFISMSIAYLLNQPFEVHPVCGVSDLGQLDDIFRGADIRLPEDMVEKWTRIPW